MSDPKKLGEAVKLYGYAKERRIKLYGKELELLSDPVEQQDENVFVDAREPGTDAVRRVQIPRNVVKMAKAGRGSQHQ